MPASNANEPTSAGCFESTLWSVVLLAGDNRSPDAMAALEKLCGTYWYPLYAYLRRCGHNQADAQDLIQGFFARLLEKNFLQAVRQERGRFRWFLLSALKRFVTNEWHREHAVKRGGERLHLSIDEVTAEGRYRREISDELTPEKLFDRSCAITLLECAQDQLCREYKETGRSEIFERLKIFLSGDCASLSYAEVGRVVGMSEGAVKVAVHRLRQRYRECLREQIAQTVSTTADVDEEIRQLFNVFS